MIELALVFLLITLGLGAFSSLVFIWQWAIGAPTVISASALLVAVAAAFVQLFLYLKRRIPQASVTLGGPWMTLFLVVMGFVGYWTFEDAETVPHGGWDAWAIWNLHARFLYRGGSNHWKDLFANGLGWSHNEYPLLVPALVNGIWTIGGSEQTIVPAILSKVFAFLAVGIICTATSTVSRDQRGWLVGLIFLAMPSFLSYSSAQMADIPLGVYILATVVFLRFAETWRELRTSMLVLAGLSAGFAAWTKNEGLPFIIVVFLTCCVTAVVRRAWRGLGRDLMNIGLGVAPIFILFLSFKLFLSPPTDIQLDAAAVHRLTDFGRYRQIAVFFAKTFAGFGDVSGGINPAILLGVYVLLFLPPKMKFKWSSLSLLLLPLTSLAIYFIVYVITPYDLSWHLNTSFDRLLLHLWPVTVFIISTTLVPVESGSGPVLKPRRMILDARHKTS
jgi:hypothetical protein